MRLRCPCSRLHQPTFFLCCVERLQGKAGAKGRAGAGAGKAAARRAAIEEADEDEEAAGGGDGSGGADGAGGGKQEQRFDWPSFRADCVSILVKAMAADFRAMWPMGLPEEVRGWGTGKQMGAKRA